MKIQRSRVDQLFLVFLIITLRRPFKGNFILLRDGLALVRFEGVDDGWRSSVLVSRLRSERFVEGVEGRCPLRYGNRRVDVFASFRLARVEIIRVSPFVPFLGINRARWNRRRTIVVPSKFIIGVRFNLNLKARSFGPAT